MNWSSVDQDILDGAIKVADRLTCSLQSLLKLGRLGSPHCQDNKLGYIRCIVEDCTRLKDNCSLACTRQGVRYYIDL